jgi:hypothetical protein
VLVESVSLETESRVFTTLEALAAAPLPKASGPVVMLVGEVFRDRAALESVNLESLQRQVAAERCRAG